LTTPCASKRIFCPFHLGQILYFLFVLIAIATPLMAQQINAPNPQASSISGSATDAAHEIVPGATVTLQGPALTTPRTLEADDNGAFAFQNLNPGGPYYISITVRGFVPWTSPALTLQPGQVLFLSGVALQVSGGETSVTVSASSVQLATEQVNLEEKQRVFGIIPNFYVVYDHNAAPLTPKLKFKLALKTETDPVIFFADAFLAGLDQAGDTPNYVQGAQGYGERFGAAYTTDFTDILIGGAVLPTLLHQDPRYFYQGTGTIKSRLVHALSSPFICKGDDGLWQPNFSSMGGDLAAGAISETYNPASNRGPGLVLQGFLITSSGRMASGVIQEFILRKLTSHAQK
jgi:hypothetical protein